jgi:hypothetical protein
LDTFNKHDIKCYKLSNTGHKIENIKTIESQLFDVKKDNRETLPNSVRSASDDFWIDFRSYLSNEKHSKSSIRDKVSYARRFYHILQNKDASSVVKLTPDTKSHVMKALAALSKFLGKYDDWLGIIKRYQLKWSNGNKSINTFRAVFDSDGNDLKSMLKWIKGASTILPQEYKNILLFNTLTGLRPDEAQKSIWLIKTKENDYIDNGKGLLKHYQFPSIFLRKTKNAYVSIIDDQILKIARNTPDKENYYNSLRKKISIKNNYGMNMYFCRKVFATYLRNRGIEAEIIDWLQGRSTTVFVSHYFRPDINEIITKRIKPILNDLQTILQGCI